ncbi:hypothetical protein ACCO45_004702 [Purpureocillium lilacinum]|uniref:Uncharacterized protein n=1 Tax=Purpureocillium lilacinum TaxID=33203 RepID=A0ACC4DW85_PURLI
MAHQREMPSEFRQGLPEHFAGGSRSCRASTARVETSPLPQSLGAECIETLFQVLSQTTPYFRHGRYDDATGPESVQQRLDAAEGRRLEVV